jgi:sterol desaturase/sphingolipid hydroxylase (fatty acid hydroxylase superfamily)
MAAERLEWWGSEVRAKSSILRRYARAVLGACACFCGRVLCGSFRPRDFAGAQVRCLLRRFLEGAPAAEWCTNHVPNPGWIVHGTVEPWPIVLRLALYIVVADFGHYWMHRILHHPLLWRFHKWHHAPTHMTWLSGNRESFVDRILVSLPYIWAYPIIHGNTPWWVPVALLCFHAFKNDWMHLNVTFRLRGLERAFVTPHFHHIHHSDNPEHFNKNLGALFSVWDRMFGTYANPDQVRSPLTFGIGEKLPLVRLYTGF